MFSNLATVPWLQSHLLAGSKRRMRVLKFPRLSKRLRLAASAVLASYGLSKSG
jgi:hypothetical protein